MHYAMPLSTQLLRRTTHAAAGTQHIHPSLLPTVLSSSNLITTSRTSTRNGSQRIFEVATRTRTGSLGDQERVVPFYMSQLSYAHNKRPIGYLRQEVVNALRAAHAKAGASSSWSFCHGADATDDETLAVSFANQSCSNASRTAVMHELVSGWKSEGLFGDILRGWSDEQFPVFDHHAVPGQPTTSFNNMAFDIERAALPLFGFPNYGCLLTAYIRDVNNQLKLWIPQRSMKKKTWPGALDVTVGGGIETCSSALKTIIRECTEEASLPTAFVQDHAQFTSILPFPNRSPSGWILPGRYFLFEMELPGDGSIQPELNPADTEVESFHLMDVEEVLHSLADGKFKSSSALAMIRFLIGHGAITEHSEPQFGTICRVLEGNAA